MLNYHNAGKVQASSEPQDMRLQRMLGHLTTLLPPQADSVLVIGFGAGVTAGAVSVSPAVTYETIAEIEPLVPKFVSKNFAGPNNDVANNPKVHIKIDDARHFLLTTKQHFDAITSDPFDPWVKGAGDLVHQGVLPARQGAPARWRGRHRLRPAVREQPRSGQERGGDLPRCVPRRPGVRQRESGGGYDVVLVGQKNARPIDVDAIEARLRRRRMRRSPSRSARSASTRPSSSSRPSRRPPSDLKPWLADAQVNRDRNLRLQYLAGLGLNLYDQDSIYKGMIRYRTWPEGVFAGSPETLAQLRAMIGGTP